MSKNEARHAMMRRVGLLKVQRGCVDCGFRAHPAALDFDHRDPTTKVANIARMVRDRVGWVRIAAEIEKCDVRCANCHRIRTAGRPG